MYRKIIGKDCKYKIIVYICERMSVLHHIQHTVRFVSIQVYIAETTKRIYKIIFF